jgi:hypothetical protein
VPGLEWVDANGHTFKVVITKVDFNDFINKECFFRYQIHMKALGLNDWVFLKEKVEYINNNNVIELSSGFMMPDPSIYKDNSGILPDYASTHALQFNYFVLLLGKNTFNVPVSLYFMLLNRILTLENLTLPNE